MSFDATSSMATPSKKRLREEDSEESPESMAVLSKKRLREEDSEGSPGPANAQTTPAEVIEDWIWFHVEETDEYSHEWFEPLEQNDEMRTCREKLLDEIRQFVGDRDPYTCIPKYYQTKVLKDKEPRVALLRAILEGLRETMLFRRIESNVEAEKSIYSDWEEFEEEHHPTDGDKAPPARKTCNNTQPSDEGAKYSDAEQKELLFEKGELDEANRYLEYVKRNRCVDCEHEDKTLRVEIQVLKTEISLLEDREIGDRVSQVMIEMLTDENRLLQERIAELEKMNESRIRDQDEDASLRSRKRKRSN